MYSATKWLQEEIENRKRKEMISGFPLRTYFGGLAKPQRPIYFTQRRSTFDANASLQTNPATEVYQGMHKLGTETNYRIEIAVSPSNDL